MSLMPKPAPSVKPTFQFVDKNADESVRAGNTGSAPYLSVVARGGESWAGAEHTQMEATMAKKVDSLANRKLVGLCFALTSSMFVNSFRSHLAVSVPSARICR